LDREVVQILHAVNIRCCRGTSIAVTSPLRSKPASREFLNYRPISPMWAGYRYIPAILRQSPDLLPLGEPASVTLRLPKFDRKWTGVFRW